MSWLNGFRSGSQRNSSRQWAKMVIIFSLLQILLISGVHAAGSGGPSGILPLNQGWLFGGEYTVGGEAPAFDDSSFQQITIPHSVVPLGWKNSDNNTWNKVWLYRRYFDLPNSEIAGSLRIFLDFDGVLTITTPTINGYVLPSHSGGYLPFSYEITDYVNKTDNILAVVVDSRWSYVNPEGSPHGPQSVDYLEPGGINRDVALRTVPSSFIKDVFAKPDNVLNDSRQVVVEVTIDSAKAPGAIRIQCQLQDSGEVLSRANEVIAISQSGNRTFTLNITAPSVRLWSPDAPKLYKWLQPYSSMI
jgi:beta-galactosidase